MGSSQKSCELIRNSRWTCLKGADVLETATLLRTARDRWNYYCPDSVFTAPYKDFLIPNNEELL